MANGTNAPFGIKPTRFLSGATWNGAVNEYFINPAQSTTAPISDSFYTNDLVSLQVQLTDTASPPTTAAQAGGYLRLGGYRNGPYTATAPVGIWPGLGSFQGCRYVNAQGNEVFSPSWIGGTAVYANTLITAFVADDPNIIYQVQVSNSVAENIGGNQYTTLTPNRIGNYPFAAVGEPKSPLTLSYGVVGGINGNPTTQGNPINGHSYGYLDLNILPLTANFTPIRFYAIGLAKLPNNAIGPYTNPTPPNALFNIAEVIMIDHFAKVVPPLPLVEVN